MKVWPLIVALAIAVSALLLAMGVPIDPANEEAVLRLACSLILGLGIVIAAAGRVILHDGWRTVHYGFVWSCVFAAMLVAFSYRDDLQYLVARAQGQHAVQSVALSQARVETELLRGWDGHYRADAIVNGVGMRLMVDTGASMVLIPYEQASAIGFEPGELDFSVPVVTANGRSTVAPVMIGAIRVDDIVVQEVQAAIAQPGKLTNGLLGMSFLDRLGETSFQGNKLYLRQAVTLGPNDFTKPSK